MDERARRIGENEAIYRAVNEKIGDLNETFGLLTDEMTVVCECGDLTCTDQIQLEIPDYERVRRDPTFFVVVPGHEIPDVETVVEKHETWTVVRKNPGGPAELARDLA